MNYLASVSSANPTKSNNSTRNVLKTNHNPQQSTRQQVSEQRQEEVKNQILKSNPILEAFGNAKTVRNNNSSRFGKYMEIFFDHSGIITGGQVTNFLLEKSRVISQTASERSFHIFYQIFTDRQLKQKLYLDSPQHFNYLNNTGCYTVPDINDEKEFVETKNALEMIGVSKDTQGRIFELLAAILHMGNLQFEASGNGCKVTNKDVLKIVAYQLQLDEQSLEHGLTTKAVEAGGRRNSLYFSPLRPNEAMDARDALSKSLYGKIFDLIVSLINRSLENSNIQYNAKDTNQLSIGILDIYGFEIFEKNSFEQLCINYVNERLQKIFIELTLKLEQIEYENEGIKWERIPYIDNTPTVTVIDSNQMGVFSLLNEACLVKKTDQQFLESLKKYTKDNKSMAWMDDNKTALNKAQNLFTVKHYAGDVAYDVNEFVQKNTDTLFHSLINMIGQSECQLVAGMFESVLDAASTTGTDGKKGVSKRPPMIATQFKKQVDELMDKLYKCNTHYVRCMKPNMEKKSGIFKEDLMTHQIRYLGLVENIHVRRAGFVYRQKYEKFVQYYGLIVSGGPRALYGIEPREASERIVKTLLGNIQSEEVTYAMGKTKLFLRTPETVFSFEEMRQRKLPDYAVKIQRFYRRYLAKKYFVDLRDDVRNLFQKLGKKRRRVSFHRTLLGDNLNLQYEPSVIKLLDKNADGTVMYSGYMTKTNHRLKHQVRILLITNKSLYILDKKQKRKSYEYRMKRKLDLNDIDGAQLSPYTDNFLVLGYPKRYDYVIQSDDKTEIVAVLLRVFKENLGREFSVNIQTSFQYRTGKTAKKTVEFVEVKNPSAQPVTFQSAKSTVTIQVRAEVTV
jgi:myosin-1